MSILIINRNIEFGTYNGIITKNEELRSILNKNLKSGTATKLVDNDETLMYSVGDCEHHATKTSGYNWECLKCGKKVILK